MSYTSQYEQDMEYAYKQIQEATENAWSTPEYRMGRALSALLAMTGNMYKIIAEIGDKINGENE